jgi:sugar-specific transcriptional regulator TrmB
MDNIVDYLKQLDLSDVEAKLYLTLLKSGPTSVRDLAATIDIKRTTTYFYIDQLVEKGLIIKLVRGAKKLVSANEPESLKPLVEEKLAQAKTVKQDFPTILKTLANSLPQDTDMGNAEVRYYKGANGVRKIYEEALQADELLSYVNITDVENMFPSNINIFDQAFQKNKKLTIREIVEDSPASRNQVKLLTQNARYHFKFLPRDVKIAASDILIYNGNVAIISVREHITGVIFHNVDYHNISKELFNFMWRMLPDTKNS